MTSQSIQMLARDPVEAASRIPPPRRRWITRIGLPALIVLIAAALLGFASRDFLWPATEVRIVRTIAKLSSTDHAPASQASNESRTQGGLGAVVAQAPGWVEPDPFPIQIPALAEGTIREMLVLEGDTVTAGQVVARMIDEDAKLALRRAQAQVALRQAALDAAQADWDNPVTRERAIGVSEAMVKEAHAEAAQVEAMVAAERAKLAELESHLRRLDQLPEDLIEEDRVERARYQTAAQRAAVEAILKRAGVVAAQGRRYEVELDAAKRDMMLRITEKQALAEAKAMLADAVAALDEAQLTADRMQITSPASGIVMQRFAAPGVRMMLSIDQPNAGYVAELYDPMKLQVRADVPLGDAAIVGVGQRAQVIVDVLPDRIFTGRVTRLVHQADIGKNTIQVKVAIEDPVAQLKPEMLARVKFFAQPAAEDAAASPAEGANASASLRVFVPEQVVIKDAEGAAVWTVDAKSNTARRKKITLGSIRQQGWIETLAGLNPGDTVITSPKDLQEGQRVRVVGEVDDVSKQ